MVPTDQLPQKLCTDCASTARRLPRNDREADDEGEDDAEADEQDTLAELLGAGRHARLVARS